MKIISANTRVLTEKPFQFECKNQERWEYLIKYVSPSDNFLSGIL